MTKRQRGEAGEEGEEGGAGEAGEEDEQASEEAGEEEEEEGGNDWPEEEEEGEEEAALVCSEDEGEEEGEEGEEEGEQGAEASDEESDEAGDDDVDWEAQLQTTAAQLRSMLECRSDGLHPHDENVIDFVLTRRNKYVSARQKVSILSKLCLDVLALREQSDPSFVADEATLQADESMEDVYEAEMDADGLPSTQISDHSENYEAGLRRDGLSPRSMPGTPGTPCAAASPSIATPSPSSAAEPYNTRPSATRLRGAPAWKAAAGMAARDIARDAERLRHAHKSAEAAELLSERLLAEGAPISNAYAAKQAKEVVTQLYANAGGLANAIKVAGKLAQLPEMRSIIAMVEDTNLDARLVQNVVDFMAKHLPTKGTRHGEDQNIYNALLVALVDGSMVDDKLISAVAKVFGARWHAVKAAVVTRLKLDDELTEGQHGIWTRRKREVRSDMYQLPGLNAMCHNEEFFKFSSRHSQPLRKHVGFREYEVRSRLSSPDLTYHLLISPYPRASPMISPRFTPLSSHPRLIVSRVISSDPA